MFGELLELGLFVWVVDEFGHRKKVRVKDEAAKQRLLAKNKVLRAKLAKRKKKK
jgi:hypothetical protein